LLLNATGALFHYRSKNKLHFDEMMDVCLLLDQQA